MTITSLALPRQDIAAVIERYLNDQVLRAPQTVSGFELDDEIVLITLSANGNGHAPQPASIATPSVEEVAQPADPAAPRKSGRAGPRCYLRKPATIGPEEQAEIYDYYINNRHLTIRNIAEHYRVSETSLYSILAAERKRHNQTPIRRGD